MGSQGVGHGLVTEKITLAAMNRAWSVLAILSKLAQGPLQVPKSSDAQVPYSLIIPNNFWFSQSNFIILMLMFPPEIQF